ncbi:MAG: hypothetical protein M3Y84_15080 [Acidobacteriota bacterium]|nr:hypothetical protein [Acidobacteriota bacterium]
MREERKANKRDEGDVWKGIAAGLVGGLVASWTMNQFQAAWTKAVEGFEKPHGAQSMKPSEGQNPRQDPEQHQENQDDATVKAARAISEGIFGHTLEERQKRVAGVGANVYRFLL